MEPIKGLPSSRTRISFIVQSVPELMNELPAPLRLRRILGQQFAVILLDIRLPGIEEDPELKSYLLPVLVSAPVRHFLRIAEGEQGIRAVLLSPSLPEAVLV